MPRTSKLEKTGDRDDELIRELSDIKRLLAVLLMKAGTPQSEIAMALGIDQGNLSRMLPARKFTPFHKKGEGE